MGTTIPHKAQDKTLSAWASFYIFTYLSIYIVVAPKKTKASSQNKHTIPIEMPGQEVTS